ncbi:MAG: DUF433 domain-containing protein [Desulfobacterales bacterium]|nr:DUF433 domain-containing protein [Desulfobacterales bacterium]
MQKEHEMQPDWRDHIVSTPDVLRGKPRIKGTRILVSLILGYLAAGNTVGEIIKEFPDLAKQQIAACLDYARELSSGKLQGYHRPSSEKSSGNYSTSYHEVERLLVRSP